MITDGFDYYLSKNNGNQFAAVNEICKIARNIISEHPGHISDKDAIKCASLREDVNKYLSCNSFQGNILDNILFDVLSCVTDECVIDSVRSSMEESIEAKHLIYLYNTDDEYKCIRIRILCNIAWYKFLEYTMMRRI